MNAPATRFVDWLRLCRAPNTLTAVADVFAGAAVAGYAPFSPEVLLVAFGGGLLYAGGVALNDVADVEKDRVGAPQRPLPSGRLPLEGARRIGGVLLVLGAATSALASGPGIFFSLLTIGAILVYDFARGPRLLGSLALAVARGANLLRGAVVFGFANGAAWNAAALHAALIALVTYLSTFEDDEPGAAPSPGLLTAARFLPWTYLGPAFVGYATGGVPSALFGGLCSTAVAAYVTAYGARREASPVSLVPRAVFGLVLLDAAYLLTCERRWEAAIVAAFFFVAGALRRAIAQAGA
jgi:uncharacterized membrane protein (UPF0136 family)